MANEVHTLKLIIYILYLLTKTIAYLQNQNICLTTIIIIIYLPSTLSLIPGISVFCV